MLLAIATASRYASAIIRSTSSSATRRVVSESGMFWPAAVAVSWPARVEKPRLMTACRASAFAR